MLYLNILSNLYDIETTDRRREVESMEVRNLMQTSTIFCAVCALKFSPFFVHKLFHVTSIRHASTSIMYHPSKLPSYFVNLRA